ncbi:MAG: efflux RND transporter periplasmic adaptor subunit [Thiobacillus sp.]|nr:efflux RND transporter periplasmic adaptor subunit [Thiobacillus sp.]
MTDTTKLQEILARDRSGGRSRRWRLGLIAAVAVLAAGALYLGLRGDEAAKLPQYKTEPVALGNLVVKVSATGNLQPTNKVDVGSELSGIVDKVMVDDNDPVRAGQVLARLDQSKLIDTVTKSQANLDAAEAAVLQARATVAETSASLARMRQVAELSGGKVPSKSELDTAEANLKRAQANEASALASVAQARASLQSDRTNLAKAFIRSPIDGVVLARKVEPGQTVAASLQAPVLFTLAEDLARMELQVDVDEADVGRVKAGQKASFTVDAWPGRQYAAIITRVSYGAQEENGVVSYQTVLRVDNDDLSLRPGMTGTADIVTLTRDNVLLVPNAALRFTPETPAAVPKKNGSVLSAMMPRMPRQTPKAQGNGTNGQPRVWVLRGGRAVPVDVQTGASDGKHTEIVGGDLKAGTAVITESLGSQP